MRKFSSLVIAMGVSLPSVVLACPQCAQNAGPRTSFLIMLGLMILLPYPVVASVIYLVKKGEERDASMLAEDHLQQ